MQTLKIFLVTVALCVSQLSLAAETTTGTTNSGVTALKSFFDGLTTFTANFEQTVQNAQLSTVEKTSGALWIERPGKFRWNYAEPYLQEIVSDGNKIWIYDADLEQVTVKDAKAALGQTPALLLSGTQPIAESFTIHELGNEAGLAWVELTSKDAEAGFSGMRLGFKGNILQEMLLQDNLGQTTRINFNGLAMNFPIDPKVFQFTVPEGADVFETSD